MKGSRIRWYRFVAPSCGFTIAGQACDPFPFPDGKWEGPPTDEITDGYEPEPSLEEEIDWTFESYQRKGGKQDRRGFVIDRLMRQICGLGRVIERSDLDVNWRYFP